METFLELLTFLLLLISLPVAATAQSDRFATFPDLDYVVKGRYLGCYLYPLPFCNPTANENEQRSKIVPIPNSSYPVVDPWDCFVRCYGVRKLQMIVH